LKIKIFKSEILLDTPLLRLLRFPQKVLMDQPPLELFSLEEKAALLPGGLFVSRDNCSAASDEFPVPSSQFSVRAN
jgi:hypothetical protein